MHVSDIVTPAAEGRRPNSIEAWARCRKKHKRKRNVTGPEPKAECSEDGLDPLSRADAGLTKAKEQKRPKHGRQGAHVKAEISCA